MKINKTQLKKIIQEEIMTLFEQPDVAPTSHVPNVGPPGGEMSRADAREIENLDRDIKGWTKIHEQIVEKAMELGADPQLVDFYRGDFEQLTTAMLDMLYQKYQMQRMAPPV